MHRYARLGSYEGRPFVTSGDGTYAREGNNPWSTEILNIETNQWDASYPDFEIFENR